jgi:hypothetical protein
LLFSLAGRRRPPTQVSNSSLVAAATYLRPLASGSALLLAKQLPGPNLTNTCFTEIIRAMKTKLTLTVEDSAVRKLKSLAARRRTSVSALLEEWSARSIPAVSGPSLGQRLRGRWATRSTSGDPRLEFLLRKHAA